MSTQKITVKEINEMINEEVAKAQKAIKLKKEYDALTMEEKQLKEEMGLDEVEVGGRKSGEEWYEKDVPVAKFEKIGSHLKEMDMEDDMEMESEMGHFEAKLAELGRELDAKLSDDMDSEESEEMDMDMGSDDESGDMEMDMDMGSEEEEEESEIMEITLDEEAVEESETVAEEAIDEDEVMEEQEGDTIVNAADQDTVNDNMEKVDNDNPMADKMYEGEEASEEVVAESEESEKKEDEVLSEGKTEKSNLITEGMSESEADSIKKELARMKALLG